MTHVTKQENGCWLWNTKTRYGSFVINYKTYSAHKISYMLFKGEIPESLQVLHNCPSGDTGLCVNPDHLWLGTQKENIRDCINKGRWRKMTPELSATYSKMCRDRNELRRKNKIISS